MVHGTQSKIEHPHITILDILGGRYDETDDGAPGGEAEEGS